MNWILKNKNKSVLTALLPSLGNKSSKTLFVVLFLVFGFFVSFDKVSAAIPEGGTRVDCKFYGKTGVQKSGSDCFCLKGDSFTDTFTMTGCFESGTQAAPEKYNGTPVQALKDAGKELKQKTEGWFETAIKFILVGILNLVGWLLPIAATLFAWIIDPANVSGANGMLNKPAVKDVWIMVRDTLNMTFILILLFAAFCTIFQVSKWNLKTVWLNILINALLVNFSFPIARFFIDVSNVAFYYFVNHLFSATGTTVVNGNSIFAMFGASSKMGELLAPGNYTEYSIAYLIAMIIITFIVGMTLLVVAGLFVVRLVMLTMLIMFSPVGFVGFIFPATKGYADKWWTQLFAYSFFAPIMIFMMAIALRITEAMGKENFSAFQSNAYANSTAKDASWIADAAFLAIPIIILWIGMGLAKSFGIAGADAVVGAVKKGGKWLAKGAYWGAFRNPVARGFKEGVKEKSKYNALAKWWKDPSAIEAAVKGGIVNIGKEGGISGGVAKGWNKTRQKIISDENKKKISENAQDHIDSGATAEDLFRIMNDSKKSKIDQAAAASAYNRFDYNDKRAHTMATLTSSPAGRYGDHDEALRTTVHAAGTQMANEQARAVTVANAIKAGGQLAAALTKDDHAALAAYINKHAKAKLAEGVKTKG